MARTILLADDSMTIQKVVELTFMDEDYQVVAVSDGSSAIQKMSEMRPDLLIADVHMPGAGGYDVCRHAKANLPGLPVLLLVGTFEQFDENEAAACGSDGHLKKPFDSQELLNRVEALVSASAAAGSGAPAVGPPASEPMVLPSAMPQEARMPQIPSAAPAAPQPVAPEPAAPQPAAPEPATASAGDTVDTRPMERKTAEAPVAPVAPPAEAPVPAAPAPAEVSASGEGGGLSDGDVDRIARRVAELLSEKILKEVAWEVLPDLAEVVVRERIHELERQVESA